MLLYNSHRYLFKYNSVGTSPTYTDTPLSWKLGKYILFLVILLVIFATSRFTFRKSVVPQVFFSLSLLLLAINFLNVVFYRSVFFDEIEYILLFLMTFPFFFISERVIEYISENLDYLIELTAKFFIVSDIFVFANFVFFDRLPALAYEGSLMIRFGGFWDDPNGFGLMSVFLLFCNFQKRRYFLSLGLLFCIILTGSLSSFILLFISIIYWSGIVSKRVSSIFFYFGLVSILFAVTLFVSYNQEIFNYLAAKQSSLNAHTKFNIGFTPLPLLLQPLRFHESWLWSFFINYFPISIFIIGMIFHFVFNAFFKTRRTFIHYFLLIFLFGNLFIPFFYVFPLNFIFFLFVVLHSRIAANTEVVYD